MRHPSALLLVTLLSGVAIAAPAAPTPPPAAPPAVAPPSDTEVFVAELYLEAGKVAPPTNITDRIGYDNQPAFTLDGKAVLYVAQGEDEQTDVWRYEIASGARTQVTRTPQSEYSPTPLPGGGFSAVRVESPQAEGEAFTESQHLYRYGIDGVAVGPIAASVNRIGYHAWIDATHFAAFIVGNADAKLPNRLVLVEAGSGKATPLAVDVGRSLGRTPDGRVSFVDKSDAKAWKLVALAPGETKPTLLIETPPNAPGEAERARSEDYCWLPDGSLLMAKGRWLLRWDGKRDSGWSALAELKDLPGNITRLAVSRDGRRLALVVEVTDPDRLRGIRG